MLFQIKRIEKSFNDKKCLQGLVKDEIMNEFTMSPRHVKFGEKKRKMIAESVFFREVHGIV